MFPRGAHAAFLLLYLVVLVADCFTGSLWRTDLLRLYLAFLLSCLFLSRCLGLFLSFRGVDTIIFRKATGIARRGEAFLQFGKFGEGMERCSCYLLFASVVGFALGLACFDCFGLGCIIDRTG